MVRVLPPSTAPPIFGILEDFPVIVLPGTILPIRACRANSYLISLASKVFLAKMIEFRSLPDIFYRFFHDVIDFVIKTGGIEYAEKISRDFADKAKVEIMKVNDLELSEPLLSLLEFIITRKK